MLSIEELEESIRLHYIGKGAHYQDGYSWFKLVFTSYYKLKRIEIHDFTDTLETKVFEASNIQEVLSKCFKHFEED